MTTGIIEASIVFVSLFAALAPIFLLVLIFFIPFCPDSECAGYWKRFPFLLLQLFAIPAGFFVVTMLLLVVEMRGYFADHFDEYKCSPWFMPFVSFIRPDVSTTANFESCTSEITSAVFSALSSPLLDLSDALGGGLNLLNDNMGTVQKSHDNLHSNMLGTFGEMNNHMGAFQAAVQYVSTKVSAIFSKMMALVFDLYYALLTVMDMINVAILIPNIIIQIFLLLSAIMTVLGAVFFIIMYIYIAIGVSDMFFVFTIPEGLASFVASLGYLQIAFDVLLIGSIFLGLSELLKHLEDIAQAANANY